MFLFTHLHSKFCKNYTIYLKIVYVVEVEHIFSLKLVTIMFIFLKGHIKYSNSHSLFEYCILLIISWNNVKIIYLSNVAVKIVWRLDWEFRILISDYQLKEKSFCNLDFYHIKLLLSPPSSSSLLLEADCTMSLKT